MLVSKSKEIVMKKFILFILIIIPALLLSSEYQTQDIIGDRNFKKELREAKKAHTCNSFANIGMTTSNIALGFITLIGSYFEQPVVTTTGLVSFLVMSTAQITLNCMCCCQVREAEDEEYGDL